MHLGLSKRNTKIHTYKFDNVNRDYNGGFITYMKLARQSIILFNKQYVLITWVYIKSFFKSFLWLFHKKTTYKGEITVKKIVETTLEGVVIGTSEDKTFSDNIKRVTYFLFRVIPIFTYRSKLTEEEIENLTK